MRHDTAQPVTPRSASPTQPEQRDRLLHLEFARLKRSSLWMILLAGAGCSAPNLSFGDCELKCEASCPGGMRCDEKSGYCVHPDSHAVCGVAGATGTGGGSALSSQGGSSASQSSAAAGTQSSSGSTAAGGGTSGSGFGGIGGISTEPGGTGGTSLPPGDGGGPSAGGTTTSEPPFPTGGTPPIGGTAGAGGSAGTGGVAGAAGTPPCEGANAVAVTSTNLSGCVDEVYSGKLTATGCGASDCEWTVELPPELPLVKVVTATGETKLEGNLPAKGSFSFFATAVNKTTGCASPRTSGSLVVSGSENSLCPTIRVVGQDQSIPVAPPACRGADYSAVFKVIGGGPQYWWTAVSLPSDLKFNPTNQTVSGTLNQEGTIVLRVTDGVRVVQKSLAVSVREKCWLAYLVPEAAGSQVNRLHLFDPFLKRDVQPQASTRAESSVKDFKFSPDGKYLAYRLQDSTGNFRLVLALAPTWSAEVELDFGSGASVTNYVWSDNSGTLAVAYDTESAKMLGGVSIGKSPFEVAKLTPILATVATDITWHGSDNYVAFTTPVVKWGNNFSAVSRAKFNPAGFQDLVTSTSVFDPALRLHASSSGIFACDEIGEYVGFYGINVTMAVGHTNVAIAPSGAYTAYSLEGQLRVYRPEDVSEYDEDPWIPAAGCSAVLTWAQRQERLLCADSDAKSYRIFTVDPIGPSAPSVIVTPTSADAWSAWNGYQRILSPSGNQLALSSIDQIYLGSLTASNPTLTAASTLPSDANAAEMAFSPDERGLALQWGTSVFLLDTSGAVSGKRMLGSVSTGAVSCQEDFLSSRTWCGNGRETVSYQWSADSSAIAIAQADGQLVVWDLRLWRAHQPAIFPVLATAACTGQCIGGFKFQP